MNFRIPLPSRRKVTVASLARLVPARCWETRSCGSGCKGHRDYDWAWAATASPRHWVLIRRNTSDPSELAFFCCHAPAGQPVSLPALINAAGKRWPVEECHQQARARPASISTRSGSGPPSTGTPCCPCARSPCSRSPPPARCPRPRGRPRQRRSPGAVALARNRHPPGHRGRAAPARPRHGQGQRPRSPQAPEPGHHAHDQRRPPPRLRLVPMAAAASGTRPLPPLPGTPAGAPT